MIQLTQTESPIRSRIDTRRTDQAIKHILADGTPAWISRPQDFKQWARECYLEDKEDSDRQVLAYRMEEQDTLTDEAARMIHPMDTRNFIQKLRDNGIKCFTYQVPLGPGTPVTMLNTVGLWAEVPSQRSIGHLYQGTRHQYMTYLDIPFMFEWSVLRVDPHGLPNGEKYRGWRTVVSKLIAMKVVTEIKAHQIFGEPIGATSKIYKRTLYEFRNGRYKPNDRQLNS
jgi:hypothetical protein